MIAPPLDAMGRGDVTDMLEVVPADAAHAQPGSGGKAGPARE